MSKIAYLNLKHQSDSLSKDRDILISLVENIFREPKVTDISGELDHLAMAFLSFKDWGPTPVAYCDLKFSIEHPDELLHKLGIFFMTVVAQGNSYYEGLYGPIPVRGYENQLVYLYAFSIHDGSLEDERVENQAYSLLAIFFPRRLNSYIQPAYKVIGRLLNRSLSRTRDISELTDALLYDIKDQMKFSIYYWHLLSLGFL